MNEQIVVGATVRGPITVSMSGGREEVLVDKHLVVLAAEEGEALCMYTGTLSSNALRRLPGFVEVPTSANDLAGWRGCSSFYADACKLCVVPTSKLEPEGRVSHSLLSTLTQKAQSNLRHVRTTRYSSTAQQRVTGVRRQIANGERV